MSLKFEWEDSFSVGDADIDRQHKMIFSLANSLGDEHNQDQIKSALMVLYKYTQEHFADEEKMMHKINYPKLDEHKKLHKELIEKLDTLSNMSFEDSESKYNFITFIYDWLTHHILNKDMDYMRFTQNL